jgi:hypothetical protein
MRRFSLSIVSVVCLINLLSGQSVFYDAKKIASLHPTILNGKVLIPTNDSAYRWLRNYTSDKDSTRKLIGEAFRNNPFVSVPIPAGGLGIPKSILSSVGNLDVTGIADGLAKFLIKRGKEELNIAFFQRMKDFLDENIEAKTLFPATSKFLGGIASYRYSELLQSLREAFYKDVSNLIVNLNLLIDLAKYNELLKALPEVRVAVRSAKIISELSQSDTTSIHPANLIHRFAELKEWGEMNINLRSSWQVLDRISESVREKAPGIYDTTVQRITRVISRLNPGSVIIDTVQLAAGYYSIKRITVGRDTAIKLATYDSLVITSRTDTAAAKNLAWIKFSDFQQDILNDPVTLRIFLGLLYERMDSITFRNGNGHYTSVQDFMRDNKDDIYKVADLVENFLVLANDVEKSIKDIREKKEGLTNDDYYTYIRKAIDVTEYGFKVANLVKPGIADDRYISISRNASDLYKNIYTKSYNAAVMNAYLILDEVLAKTDKAIKEKSDFYSSLHTDSLYNLYTTAQKTIKNNDSTVFAIGNTSLANTKLLKDDSLEARSITVGRILRYGNMIASIVKSESSEEAEAAIEAAVLPAGSSSIKKNSRWNISLNAYIGGYINNYTNNTDKIDGNNSRIGVTAPIGIAISKGLGSYRNGNSCGSLSIYGTLIDVGAIAGYRLTNDSTDLEQKVTINDIFAPGAYLVYGLSLPFKGFPYIPLSVGYGWQYGSKLYQKRDDGTLEISSQSRWRKNWFVAIDIPLANFWTKHYKKKE